MGLASTPMKISSARPEFHGGCKAVLLTAAKPCPQEITSESLKLREVVVWVKSRLPGQAMSSVFFCDYQAVGPLWRGVSPCQLLLLLGVSSNTIKDVHAPLMI